MALTQSLTDYYNKKLARLQARKLRPEEAANIAKLDAEIAECQACLAS